MVVVLSRLTRSVMSSPTRDRVSQGPHDSSSGVQSLLNTVLSATVDSTFSVIARTHHTQIMEMSSLAARINTDLGVLPLHVSAQETKQNP